MKQQLARVIVGQDKVIEEVLIAVFSRGHALLVGVTGVAKTPADQHDQPRAGPEFQRIQFTPDSAEHISGTEFWRRTTRTGRRAFPLRQRPIFANMVLADRSTARLQN